MPKKAVAIYFIAALIGAAIFIYFTFPRTKEEIPASNNQRPFPLSPAPGPDGVPVPETVPHPNPPPKLPPGPTLRVMAWASAGEAKVLEAETDDFAAATGRRAALTIAGDPTAYRRDLQEALASNTPPDVCLINSRDFSGIDPVHDLIAATPNPGSAARGIAAFTVEGQIKAAPDEFSVDVLFYNPERFDQAAIGYPGPHWNWDVLEADTRALASLKLKDGSGQPVYPIELPADFDFWNILCTQAGHPVLDRDVWHLADTEGRPAQLRALEFIHDYFQKFAVAAPLPKAGEPAGRLFAQERAALLIGPSNLTAVLPKFNYSFTLLPGDMARASLARVNGWAVTAKSTQPDAALALVSYLAWQPVHAGWSPLQKPAEGDSPAAICQDALAQSLLPRVGPKTAPLVEFLDQQIYLLARNAEQRTDAIDTRIQAAYQNANTVPALGDEPPQAAGLKPALLVSPPQLHEP